MPRTKSTVPTQGMDTKSKTKQTDSMKKGNYNIYAEIADSTDEEQTSMHEPQSDNNEVENNEGENNDVDLVRQSLYPTPRSDHSAKSVKQKGGTDDDGFQVAKNN